jgi:mannosyl-oligosaccharide alpha-1,2-mannosidase
LLALNHQSTGASIRSSAYNALVFSKKAPRCRHRRDPARRGIRSLSTPHHPIALYNDKSTFHIQFDFQEESGSTKRLRRERQQQVRQAFVHAWKGFKENAWLQDEVSSLSGGYKNPFLGWAATLVHGLDSLYVMGLQDEFNDALKAMRSIDFSRPNAERVPVFETTIRFLGGLLGAYDASGGKYPLLLEKADQLGEFLFQAFDTPNGIPVPYFRWQRTGQELRGEDGVSVAKIGESG